MALSVAMIFDCVIIFAMAVAFIFYAWQKRVEETFSGLFKYYIMGLAGIGFALVAAMNSQLENDFDSEGYVAGLCDVLCMVCCLYVLNVLLINVNVKEGTNPGKFRRVAYYVAPTLLAIFTVDMLAFVGIDTPISTTFLEVIANITYYPLIALYLVSALIVKSGVPDWSSGKPSTVLTKRLRVVAAAVGVILGVGLIQEFMYIGGAQVAAGWFGILVDIAFFSAPMLSFLYPEDYSETAGTSALPDVTAEKKDQVVGLLMP